MLKVKVHGLSDLAEVLKKLPREIASKNGGPLARALRKGAKVFVDETRRNIDAMPVSNVDERDDYVRTGAYKKSVRTRRDRNPKDVTERFAVKPLHRAYVPLEFGSVKMPARPTLRPAFDGHAERALGVITEDFRKGVMQAADKAAKLRRG